MPEKMTHRLRHQPGIAAPPRDLGIGEAEWKALHGVEWTKIGDRSFLFPSDALKLSDDHVRCLDEVSAVLLGHPHELLAAADQRATMTGNRWSQIDFPERTVA